MSEPLEILLNNIKGKSLNGKTSDKKQKKDSSIDKNKCQAGAKFNTLKEVYSAIENNEEVYLIEDSVTKKKFAYSRCCKTSGSNSSYCHTHDGKKTTKNFEKDILPFGERPKLNDDFFDGMGKRGAKKKNISNVYYFEPNDPIKEILDDKNPIPRKYLYFYAMQISKNKNEIIINNDTSNIKSYYEKKNDSESEDDDNESSKNIGSYLELLSSLEKDSSIKKKEESDEEGSIIGSDSDNSNASPAEDSDAEDSDEEQSVKEDSDAESDAESEGVSCTQIETLKGKILWLNPETNLVYEPEGDDEGKALGTLKKIKKKHSTIHYDEEYYTVIEERTHEKKGLIFRCVLSNNLFDKKMNLIGILEYLRKNEYRYNFKET